MRTRLLALAAVTILPTLLSSAEAQPASMVKDIGDAFSFASPLGAQVLPLVNPVELDGVLYFVSNDGVHGPELWRSDGTAAGTRMLLDACPGICSSFPSFLTVFRHRIYWLASDGLQTQVLASDGTPQGTVLAFGPGSPAAGRFLVPMGEAGDRLLLAGLSLDHSKGELWATDGTAAGTVRLRVFRVPAIPSLIGRAGGRILFTTGQSAPSETLWATDGTAAGTLPIHAQAAGRSILPSNATAAGNRLFFETFTATGLELWASDGTAASTRSLTDVSFGPALTAVGPQVFFVRSVATGSELWKSDGTLDGTKFVKGPFSNSLEAMAAVGGRLFFKTAQELWVSDGTEAGTVPVQQFSGVGIGRLLAFGDRLAFFADDGAHGLQPWVSDGTAAGTHFVAELHPGPALGSGLGVLGGRWLFDARDGQGWFLWASDGTPGGLSKIGPLNVQTSSSILPLGDLGGDLLFSSIDSNGERLWRSDGSSGGTFSIESFAPAGGASIGGAGFFPLVPLGRAGDRFFFSITSALWATDGTTAGTLQVPEGSPLSLTSGAVKVGESLYLIGERVTQGTGLFKTDGTAAGTLLLYNFNPNTERLSQLTAVGNRLFFSVTRFNGSTQSSSLWTSDGTEAGTKPVATRHALYSPVLWTALGSRLLFSDSDNSGIQLWTSDGTAAGTYRLARVIVLPPGLGAAAPGAAAPGAGVAPGFLAVASGRVFFSGDDGVHGRELWVSDGTAGGTRMLADIARGAPGSAIGSITAVGPRVFFAADDGVHGRELWVSDGRAAGTRMVADVVPGDGSSYPGNLAAAGGVLVYSADDGIHGVEPWTSDGTLAGTRLLQDIAPGPLPSSPSGFLASGQDVYFTANDAIHGFELWAMPATALGGHP